MGVAFTQSGNTTNFADAVVYRSPTHRVQRDWSQAGVSDPDADALTSKYCAITEPFGLGSGTYVGTGGEYLMPPSEQPADKFVVINAGSSDIYAGVNIATSGTWSIDKAITIASDSSYEFGEVGSQNIRNVWAMASTGSILVQGYATNQPGY